MATYALTPNGVTRIEDGACIPSDGRNADWTEYLKWVAAGNVARPLPPGPQYDWNGSAWAVNAQRQAILDAAVSDSADAITAKAYAKLAALKAMTPAQVQAWVTVNVTNLADAKDALMTLAIAVSILARRL